MRNLFLLSVFVLIYFEANAQRDSLILSNNNVIVGEVKGMDRGVVVIETAYSKDDFRVEWSGIKKIYTTSIFIITISDGTRLNGKLEGADSGKVSIKTIDESMHTYSKDDVVYFKSLDKGFWDRVNANIDFGFGLTKSQNLKNINLRSNVGYLEEKWSIDATYNTLYSSQDEVAPIKSKDGRLTFNYFLPNDWYIPASLSFLSNTEQKINLRTLAKLGVGNYIIHTNQSYLAVAGGVSLNKEDYTEANDRNSTEGFFGTELNMFDIGDLNLLAKFVAYPSFTESGRWRADFVFDTKYDLPFDLYVKFGITVNYDNRPVEGAPETDYVFQSGIGWEW